MEVIVDEILLVILLPHAGSMQCYVKQAANSAACGALRLVHWFSCRIISTNQETPRLRSGNIQNKRNIF